ncbi:MAG TPA: alcohol dehydrogenase catalytic domain-containing protein [Gryllotalpicola sp.]
MRAIAYTGPSSLELVDVPEPAPAPGHVIVEVAALGICGTDLLIWGGGMERVAPPVVLGHEFSGTVVDAGDAAGIEPGLRVAVEPLLNCGECAPCLRGDYNVCVRLGLIGIDVDGAAARCVEVPAHRLHPIPEGLSLRDAALAEPTAVALHMFGRSGAQPGDAVLIVGGGPIGALVAAVCRAKGVERVVVSEPNPSRRGLMSALGFETFDPSAAALDELVATTAPADGFDVTFELTGIPVGLATAVDATRIQGTVLMGGLAHAPIPFTSARAVMKELTLLGARVYRSAEFDEAIALLAAGAVDAERFVTREVPLEEGITNAFEALRDSRDEMKILILP